MSINIFGVVGEDVRAADILTKIQAEKGDSIEVTIMSPGGSVIEGLAIYDALRATGKEIRTLAMGQAASIASIIFMAGDVREVADNAEIMIHNAMVCAGGNKHELSGIIDTLENIDQKLIDIYTDRTELTSEEVTKLLDKETFMSADEAVNKGFATGKANALALVAIHNKQKEPVNMADEKKEERKSIVNKFLTWLNAHGDDDMEEPTAGPKLSSLLDGAVDSMVTEDKTRSDIIMDISKAVGVEEGTVNQILSGAIDCPPEERLRGFAQVLDISMGSIMAAWDADGCAMPAEEEAKNKAADDDEPDHKMENIALKAEIAELKAKAKAADDDEEEMKAKAEEDKAKAEHEEEEEKKEEEAKALLIFDAMTSDKITKFEAKNLLTEPLDFVNKTLKSRIVNHTGGAQTESPSNEPKEDCNAIWKAMLSDGKRTEAQAYYKENSEKITKKEK